MVCHTAYFLEMRVIEHWSRARRLPTSVGPRVGGHPNIFADKSKVLCGAKAKETGHSKVIVLILVMAMKILA